jgi:hypothetical protein
MNQLEVIKDQITQAYRRHFPWTINELRNFTYTEFRVEISANTLYHVMAREPDIRACRAIPMDQSRIQVPVEDIRAHFQSLWNNISGAPAHFVFNMDEMGHQEWADAPEKVCFVPVSHAPDHVFYPVPRTGKRITLIACCSADGGVVRPAIVIPRKTFEDDELCTIGLSSEKVDIYHQPKGYIDRSIFEDWLRDTFVPEVVRRRERFCYSGPAFLLLDNCTAHSGAVSEELCALHDIHRLFLPPHSSNQLQMLDLCIFGVTKRIISRINRLEALNVQSAHIGQVVCSFLSAASPMNVAASFRNGGISLIQDHRGMPICRVTPETTRCLLDPDSLLVLPGIPEDETGDEDDDLEIWIDGIRGDLL